MYSSLLKSNKLSSRKPVIQIPKRPSSTTVNSQPQLTFFLNGQKRIIEGAKAEPEMTLIDYLRDSESLMGTKLTCGEGGCGACTVTLSHYDKESKKVVNRAVNSCLIPLCYVDGMEVTTVEGIGSTKSQIHPVQERLAVWGGSQCGYCTPGFIMSMYTSLRNDPKPKSAEFTKCMDGNLCRCTGYRPIIDAAKSFCEDTKNTVVPPMKQKFQPYDPSKDPVFPKELESYQPKSLRIQGNRSVWHTPTDLKELMELKKQHPTAKIVNGATELGIDLRFKYAEMPVLLCPTRIPEMTKYTINEKGIDIGAAITLTKLDQVLKDYEHKLPQNEKHRVRSIEAIREQLHYFAGTQIRNVASLGGNIANASPISDLNPVWVATDSSFKLQSLRGERIVPAKDFFVGYKKLDLKDDEILVSVFMPWHDKNTFIESYKQSKRREDDIAVVTGTLLMRVGDDMKVTNCHFSYGGMAPRTISTKKTSEFLIGKTLDDKTFQEATTVLKNEIGLTGDPPGGMAEFRTTLALSFFYKFHLSILSKLRPNSVPKELQSATQKLYKPVVPVGQQQVYEAPKRGTSVGDSEPHLASKRQTTGEAQYTTDILPLPREVQAYLVTSSKGYANIKSVDVSEALKYPGVHTVITHKDVPGENIWGDIVHDEELLASKQVLHYGQPIACVIADTEYAARMASRLVKVDYEDLSNTGLYTIEDAIKANSFFPTVNTLKDGDVEKGLKESDKIVEGHVNIGGQEQFYFEVQNSLAYPDDSDMIVYSSTQNANKTQKIVAETLGIPVNKVIVKLNRIGGGFGGKETRNINFSCIAAVAANKLNRPVRITLPRDMDMTISGGRHPFRGEYKVGFTNEGKIKALDVKLYNNGGLSQDLSYPVLGRALLFSDSCYKIPNVRAVGRVCKTNMPSNTAFRGFGGPQGQFVAETWIDHVARTLNKPVEEIREMNLYKEGELTFYSQAVPKNMKQSWDECKKSSNFVARAKEVQKFNNENKFRKRGIVMMPSKYGIAFTFNTLNQGAALVHIYTDGTVLVNHGGVEMGQGLHTKVAQVVATELGIPVSDVHIRDTSTDKIPNASATAASMGSDIYGMAALYACRELNTRLEPYRKANPKASFKEIANKAYFERVNLSAQGFFKSEHEGFNMDTGKGKPWRYFTLGTACTEVEIDCLTGDFKTLRADLVVDVGQSINPAIDLGQIEGAFVQGIGYTTIEELVWGDNQHPWVKPQGRLFSNGPGAYKIPAADDIPSDFRVTFMKDTPDKKHEIIAVQSSKAVGEPPLLLGMSAFFAIREAVISARRQSGLTGYYPMDSPLTSERIRMACVDQFTNLAVGDKTKAENFRAKGSF